eukprot:2999750-Amphidinium_carterae.2
MSSSEAWYARSWHHPHMSIRGNNHAAIEQYIPLSPHSSDEAPPLHRADIVITSLGGQQYKGDVAVSHCPPGSDPIHHMTEAERAKRGTYKVTNARPCFLAYLDSSMLPQSQGHTS